MVTSILVVCDIMDIVGGKMVFLSAPLSFPQFTRASGEDYGYNIIKIKFAADDQQSPLGCDIHNFKMEGCELISSVRRFFFHDSLSMAESLNPIERLIIHKINAIPNNVFLDDFLNILKNDGDIGDDFSIEQIFSIITDLYWRTLIEFKTNPENIARSKVRRKIQ